MTFWDDIYKVLGSNFGLVLRQYLGLKFFKLDLQLQLHKQIFLQMKSIETKENIDFDFAVYNVHTQI